MLVASCAGLAAQDATQASGTVTGKVIAQDTQQPARFAQVFLRGVEPTEGAARGARQIFLRTDVEGNFTATNVEPGDYYVTASATGYISERNLLQAKLSAGADPAALLAQVPVVHVTAGGSSAVTVNIERGGSIAGRVQWEDGSPASGLSMTAASPNTAPQSEQLGPLVQLVHGLSGPVSASNFAVTDDRGAFRISGLPTGDYLLRVQIQPTTQQGGSGRPFQFLSPIVVYAPGVFRRTDAKPVSLKAGDERDDVRMVIDLRSLHTVSGTVLSSNPSQTVASGRVILADSVDPTLQVFSSIQPDGSFALRYVPAGNYTLRVEGASTNASPSRLGNGNAGSSVSFQPFQQAQIVGDTDISGLALTLSPVQAAPQ
jgi:hypothetical protein